MAAITWRNVDGRSLAEAATLLNGAGQSMNNALGTLDKAISQREDIGKANWEIGKANNTQTYLDTLAQAKTAEELAALEASGKLQEMTAGFGGQVDRNQIRGALTNQLGTLRQQEVLANQHKDMRLAREQAPIIEQFKIAGLNGDNATQEALMKANPGIKWAELMAWDRSEEILQAQQKRDAQLKPLQHNLAVKQTEDQVTQVDTARQVANMEKEASAAAQAHRRQQDTFGITLGVIGKANNLPVDNLGRLRMDLLTGEQYKWLEGAVTKQLPKGIKVPNILKMYEAGDTEAADKFVSGLASKYSPELVEKARGTLRGMFNTDAGQTLVGRDANNVARIEAQQKVLDDENRGANWHAPGSANAMNNYEIVAKEIPMLIDKTTGWAPEEDVGPLQDFLHEMATVGVDVGNGVKVTPSVNDLRAVIRSADGGWFRDGKRAENARASLIRVMRDSGSLARIKEAESIKMRDRTRAAKKELSATK